ncbi:MAG: Holliday junction resolvase RuvX [Rhodospirillaceae bacterium]|nr:Holliday junction resolvase RuvX [Rhodospirillaceae bacterium]HAA93917.1 Holliday junction resolvase RuvX [Rhodospirillaceae bacterium]
MAVEELVKLAAAKPPDARWLGVDLGSKTIGLAISDPSLTIASPLETLARRKFSKDLPILQDLIAERGIGGLIFGLPCNMDGSEGPRAQSTRDFAANLGQHLPLPIGFWDERLSTAAVERLMVDEADLSRQKRAQKVDKMAAAYILQGALDALRHADE